MPVPWETWTRFVGTRSCMRASDMRFIGYVLGGCRGDRLMDGAIRDALWIYNLSDSMKQYRQGWTEKALPKELLLYPLR